MTKPGGVAGSVLGVVHGVGVSANGRGLLIVGASGSGKSALAIEMIALGAGLIVDDVVEIKVMNGVPHLAASGAAIAAVEARGVGLLRANLVAPAPLKLVIDLDETEGERLPQPRLWRAFGVEAPLLRRPPRLSPAALFLALRDGLVDPDVALATKAAANEAQA